MREFVDDGHAGVAAEDGLGVHFLEPCAAVLDEPTWNRLQPFDQRDRFLAPVRLEVADDDVDAAPLQLAGFGQHLVGLADAGGVAEEHLQASACAPFVAHCGKTRTSMPSAWRIS